MSAQTTSILQILLFVTVIVIVGRILIRNL